MLIKANVTFAGNIVMRKGEERELEASVALSDLLSCGYVSEVGTNDSKHSDTRKRKTEPEN